MSRLVRTTSVATVIILCLLQLWRPYFFLTDDNLVGWLPIVVDMGRHLVRGEDFTTLHTLYGGNYRLLQDPAALCLWNPLTLALSILAQTPAYLAIADIFVGVNLLLCSVATSLFLDMLRRRYQLPVSDRRILFFSLSYTFSAYAMLIFSTWLTFAANQAALPVWGLGLLCRDRKRGVLLVCFGFLLSFLVGHLSPFLYGALFMSAAAVGLARAQRSWEPLLRWGTGGAAAFLLASPLLWQAMLGFSGQDRNSDAHLQSAFVGAIPPLTLVLSLFGGVISVLGGPFQIIGLNPGASFAIATCAASPCIWHALGSGPTARSAAGAPSDAPHERARHAMAVAMLFCCLFVAIFLIRPPFLQAIVEQLPLYKSLRFAYRETYAFLFFFHAWLFLCPVRLSQRAQNLTMAAGGVILAVAVLPWGPPSLLPANPDRQLLISGQAHAFWRQVKGQLPPGTKIIPSIDNPRSIITVDGYSKLPQTLLASSNFPALFDVDSLSGYHILGFKLTREEMGVPGPQGLLAPEPARRLMEKNPGSVIVRLKQLEPLVIELETREGIRKLPVPGQVEFDNALDGKKP